MHGTIKNYRYDRDVSLITHKYRGSIYPLSISKSVEPNEELKVEQIFPQVLSTTDTTLRTLDVRFNGNKYETIAWLVIGVVHDLNILCDEDGA